jgi:hypothetical protein
MPLHILYHIPSTFACVVPCALVMDIAKHPLNGVGTRTVRWEPQQHQPGVACQPLLNGFRFMHTVIIHDDVEGRRGV